MKKNFDKEVVTYLNLAEEVAKKSKDPSTKVGAIIVDAAGNEISKGYNSFVVGGNEDFMTWHKKPMKYNLVIHAEMSAILSAKKDLTGCSIYTSYAPCSNCLKHILQAGITKIFYKNLLVNSQTEIKAEEKEAIIRLLSSKPDVIAKNLYGVDWKEELLKSEDIFKFINSLKQNQK